MKRLDLSGQRFHRLTAKAPVTMPNGKSGWVCVCDCGTTTTVATLNLRNGHTKSCGCLSREKSAQRMTTHGLSRRENSVDRLHYIWSGMRQRCFNPNHHAFPRYGGRGITICSEWEDFEAFHKWALANGYTPSKSIDRINNDLGYSPDNCRWADQATQSRNRSCCRLISFEGQTMTLSEWARQIGIAPATLRGRLAKWPLERALKNALRPSTRPSALSAEPTAPRRKEH